jgi:hypothetical protein
MLNREIAAALREPATQERLAKIGLVVVASPQSALTERLQRDVSSRARPSGSRAPSPSRREKTMDGETSSKPGASPPTAASQTMSQGKGTNRCVRLQYR